MSNQEEKFDKAANHIFLVKLPTTMETFECSEHMKLKVEQNKAHH